MHYNMPLTWIYNLSKQQLEELSGQLGLASDGTLDDGQMDRYRTLFASA